MFAYALARNQVIKRDMLEINKESIMADKSVSKPEPFKVNLLPFNPELSQSPATSGEYQLCVDSFFTISNHDKWLQNVVL